MGSLCFKFILKYYADSCCKSTLPYGGPRGPYYHKKHSNRICEGYPTGRKNLLPGSWPIYLLLIFQTHINFRNVHFVCCTHKPQYISRGEVGNLHILYEKSRAHTSLLVFSKKCFFGFMQIPPMIYEKVRYIFLEMSHIL